MATDTVDTIWRREHRTLVDLAFRMLGDVGQAEDLVQEAFIRLSRADLDEIDEPRAWLIVVTSRLCLDHLRSARVRREEVGESTVAAGVDPADRVTLDESVSRALLAVLQTLSPAERTAFVLHDVFQLPFDAIAEVVGRTPAACRQLASRARRHVREHRDEAVRIDIEPTTHQEVVDRFVEACAGGDLDALLAVLDPDVAGDATPGGAIPATARATVGSRRISRGLLAFVGPRSGTTLVSLVIHERPAVLGIQDGAVTVALLLDVHDGRIDHIHAVGDPEGLARAADH